MAGPLRSQHPEDKMIPDLITCQPNSEEAATEFNKVNVRGSKHKTKSTTRLRRVMFL